ncbi:transcription factor TFIIE subunit TFA2 [Sporobolomyces salmoneus]|uniref:transcription factor TFIIE subunit TFA2 n=1 Tax=Sporobolomyces salmoneus TaxID=183962 RepID=UPI00317B19D1
MATQVIGPSLTGVGRHWQTQLVLAVNFLKQLNRPIRLEDLAITSGIEALLHNYELLEALKGHDRVKYDSRTELFQYKPDFLLSSKSDLLSLLRRYSPQGGLAIKPLRESWPGVTQAIEELEQEGRVLVTRTDGKSAAGNGEMGKGQMKCVFLDDIGKEKEPLDKEFRDLWHSLKTPMGDDLVTELQTAGLTSSSLPPPNPVQRGKKGLKGKKGLGSSNRRFKITNTHLKEVDLSKDFVPQSR